MAWVLAAVGSAGFVALVVLALWWLGEVLGRSDRHEPDLHPPAPSPSPGAETFIRGPYAAPERLELPPGDEGHLMVARELETLGRLYGAAIEDRMRR